MSSAWYFASPDVLTTIVTESGWVVTVTSWSRTSGAASATDTAPAGNSRRSAIPNALRSTAIRRRSVI